MLDLKLSLQENISEKLKEFADTKTQDRLTNRILATVGRSYRSYIKKYYLAGQMLNSGRGKDSLAGRIAVWKSKRYNGIYYVGERVGKSLKEGVLLANIYEHPGGYVITPKKKKLRFVINGKTIFATRVEGKSRPFMSASFASFGWDKAFADASEMVIQRELKKAGLSNGS